jgi:inhibitor of cysteine peptidase
MLGAGGTQTFYFRATGTGQTTLKMIYARPFDKAIPPAETFSISVTVEP